jgi:hypothetical protein
MRGRITAFGEIDPGQQCVEYRQLVVPAISARAFQTMVGERAGCSDVAQVEVMARVQRASD